MTMGGGEKPARWLNRDSETAERNPKLLEIGHRGFCVVKFSWEKVAAEPFDLAALAERRRSPARERMAAQQSERARKRRRKRRTMKFWNRIDTAPRKCRRYSAECQAFAGMEPGAWYGQGDVARLIGAKIGQGAQLMNRWRAKGWAVRVPNREWSAERDGYRSNAYRKGAGLTQYIRKPKWLWALSELGEAEQAAWKALGAPDYLLLWKAYGAGRGWRHVSFIELKENGAIPGAVVELHWNDRPGLVQQVQHEIGQQRDGDREAVEFGEEGEH